MRHLNVASAVVAVLLLGLTVPTLTAQQTRIAEGRVFSDPEMALASSVGARELREYFATQPLALQKTIKSAEGRGWRATNHVVRFGAAPQMPSFGFRRASASIRSIPMCSPRLQPAQTYWGDGAQVTVWDWEDGNPATQEGSIQVQYWGSGEYYTLNLLVEFQRPDMAWVVVYWADETSAATSTGAVATQWSCDGRTLTGIRIANSMLRCIGRDLGGRVRRALENAGIGSGGATAGRWLAGGSLSAALGTAVSAFPYTFIGAYTVGLVPKPSRGLRPRNTGCGRL